MGGERCEFAQQPLDQRRIRERSAPHKKKGHLPRKSQNVPDSVVPGIDDLERVARRPDQRRYHRNERQDDGVKIRVRYVALGVAHAEASELPQHDFCPLLLMPAATFVPMLVPRAARRPAACALAQLAEVRAASAPQLSTTRSACASPRAGIARSPPGAGNGTGSSSPGVTSSAVPGPSG